MVRLVEVPPMKRFFVAAIGLVCSYLFVPSALAQTPMAIRNVTKVAAPNTKNQSAEKAAEAKAAGLPATNNPWFGAQLAQTFGKSTGFETNILATGQLV